MQHHYSSKFYNLPKKPWSQTSIFEKTEEKFSMDKIMYFFLAFFPNKRTILAEVFQKYFPVTGISL